MDLIYDGCLLLYAMNLFQRCIYFSVLLIAAVFFARRGKLRLPGGILLISACSAGYLLLYVRNYGIPSASALVGRFVLPVVMYYRFPFDFSCVSLTRTNQETSEQITLSGTIYSHIPYIS